MDDRDLFITALKKTRPNARPFSIRHVVATRRRDVGSRLC